MLDPQGMDCEILASDGIELLQMVPESDTECVRMRNPQRVDCEISTSSRLGLLQMVPEPDTE